MFRSGHLTRGAVCLALLATTMGGCWTTTTTPPPAAGPTSSNPTASGGPQPSPADGSPPATPPPAGSPSPSPAPTAIATAAGPIVPGALAVTVSSGLRVRSAPRVADDSQKYTPLLPAGTPLVVTAGPVAESGYTWFRVAPLGLQLDGGIDQGWVAVADRDGTPWVALAADSTPGYRLASAIGPLPTADLAAARAQATAINAFGLSLYLGVLRDPNADVGNRGAIVSPTSIALALAMARAGANGETAAQMDRMLGAGSWSAMAGGLGSLSSLLASRDAAWTDPGGGSQHQLALRIANMAFAQDGYPITPAYLDRIGKAFGSGLGLVDYIGATEAARLAINGWVSRQTLARIPALLTPMDVTTATRLVLVNAVYLKAEWARPFIADFTVDRAFTTLAGASIRIPTMVQQGGRLWALASGSGWQATELGYATNAAGKPLAMTLILPDDLASFEAGLTTERLAGIQAAITAEQARLQVVSPPSVAGDCETYPYQVELFLPRFRVETRAGLTGPLMGLGMTLAFDPTAADFSGMTTADRLHVGFVIHQANIDVDEEGTEAAAATAVGMDTSGGCAGPVPLTTRTLRLDRPFMYLLRDIETGAILFMGRVTDPSQR